MKVDTVAIILASLVIVPNVWSQAHSLRGRQLIELTNDNAELPQILASVAGPSSVFIPLQLGPESVPIAVSENDIFRGYKLDIADGESPLKDHVFTGQTEAVPFVHTTGYSRLVQTSSDVTDTMGIQGSLSVSYGPMISGEGAGRFMQENIASKNQVSFIYRVTHTAFARKALVQTVQPNGLLFGKGTRFIESIIYGAQLDVRYTITAEKNVDIQEIAAELKGKIGIGPLSVGFSAKFEKSVNRETSEYSMEIEAKASGVNFSIPPTLGYENFEDMNGYIGKFNEDYKFLFDGLAGQTTVDTEENILQELTPIGITLGESADYTDELDLLDSLALEQRLEDLQTVFFDALQWKETLRRAKASAETRYGTDPFFRDNIFKPYEVIALEYEAKLDEQIDACLAFRASAMTSTNVPSLYPIGFDERVLEGLTGEVYIPADFSLLGTTYEGLHYIGFAVPDQWGGVKPWMSGSARNRSFDVVASGDTPEELMNKLNNPIEPPSESPTQSPSKSPVVAPVNDWMPPTEYPAYLKASTANLFFHAWGGSKEGANIRLHGNKNYAFANSNSQFRIIEIGGGKIIICLKSKDLCLHSWGGSKQGSYIRLHHGRSYALSVRNSQYKIIHHSNGNALICAADGTDLCMHTWGGTNDGNYIRLNGGINYAKGVSNSQYLIKSYGLGPFGPNVALRKPTKQSSTGHGGASRRAVDGNTDGRFSAGSVTHTARQTNPSWEVDLLGNFWVHRIKIFNRVDCCAERLEDTIITLYDETKTKKLVRNGPSRTIGVYSFDVDYEAPFPVRFVSISLKGSSLVLSLAEVEVNGTPAP